MPSIAVIIYALTARIFDLGGPEHVGEGRILYKADKPMDDTVDSDFGQRYFFVNAHDQDRVLYQVGSHFLIIFLLD